MAMTPTRPGTVYALVESRNTGLYRSDDGGESWRKPMDGDAPFFVRARPFYFSNIEVDPADHQRVYVPNLFLTVSNMFNKDPPVVASGPGGFPYASAPTNPGLYDVLGRMFRAGVRFGM